MADLNPLIRYEFKSRMDKTVSVRGRLGEKAARAFAMQHFYGPPDAVIPTRNGDGLLLLHSEEVSE